MLWEAEVGCWDAHPLFEIELGNLEPENVKISFPKNQCSENQFFFEIAILKNASLRFHLENGIWNFVMPFLRLLISRIMLPPFLLEHTPLDL
jgi:hypothetical protein